MHRRNLGGVASIDSLFLETHRSNFINIFFKLILRFETLSILYKIGLRWVPQKPGNAKPKLVQVIAWCRQAQAITWAIVDPYLFRHIMRH